MLQDMGLIAEAAAIHRRRCSRQRTKGARI
jgi:hypothetical protein